MELLRKAVSFIGPDLSGGGDTVEYAYGEDYGFAGHHVPLLPPISDLYASQDSPFVFSTGYESLSQYPNVGAVIDALYFKYALCQGADPDRGVFDSQAMSEAVTTADRLVCTSVRDSNDSLLGFLYPRFGLQGLLLPFYPKPLFTSKWLLLDSLSFSMFLLAMLLIWAFVQPTVRRCKRRWWHGIVEEGEGVVDYGNVLVRWFRVFLVVGRLLLGVTMVYYALQLALAGFLVGYEMLDNWELPMHHPAAIPIAILLWKSYLVMTAAMAWQTVLGDRTMSFLPNSLVFFYVLRFHASGQLLIYMPLLLLNQASLVMGSFDSLALLSYAPSFLEMVLSYMWSMNWFYEGVDIPLIYYTQYVQGFVSVVMPLSVWKGLFGKQMFTLGFFTIKLAFFTREYSQERQRLRMVESSPFVSFSRDGQRRTRSQSFEDLASEAVDDDIPQEILDQIEHDLYGDSSITLPDGEMDVSLMAKATAYVKSGATDPEEDEEQARALEQYLCKICLVETSTVVLEPCGHLCMCVPCAKTYAQFAGSSRRYMKLCPLCRGEVDGSRRIYV